MKRILRFIVFSMKCKIVGIVLLAVISLFPNSVFSSAGLPRSSVLIIENANEGAVAIASYVFPLFDFKKTKFGFDESAAEMRDTAFSKNGQLILRFEHLSRPIEGTVSLYSNFRAKRTMTGFCPFFIRPGDTITAILHNSLFSFKGLSADRYTCWNLLFGKTTNTINYNREVAYSKSGNVIDYFRMVDSVAQNNLSILSRFKNRLTYDDYRIAKERCLRQFEWRKFRFVEACMYAGSPDQKVVDTIELIRQTCNYNDPLWNKQTIGDLNKSIELQSDRSYLSFLVNDLYHFQNCLFQGRQANPAEQVDYIKGYFPKKMHELSYYLLVRFYMNRNGSPVGNLQNAVEKIITQSSDFHYGVAAYFDEVRNGRFPGVPAYHFSLQDVNGKLVRLSDFSGQTIMLHFYFYKCGACQQVHDYSKKLSKALDSKDFVVISVYWDPDPKSSDISHDQWRDVIALDEYASWSDINLKVPKVPRGDVPEMIKKYGGTGILWIDKEGKFFDSPSVPYNNYSLGWLDPTVRYIKSKM